MAITKRELFEVLRSKCGIVAVLWIVGASIAWIKCIAHGRHYLWHFKTLSPASAIVTETDEDVVEMDDGRRAAMITLAAYEFKVNGNTYVGGTHGPLGSIKEGQWLQVEYDPANPANNRERGRSDKPYEYALVVFVVSVVCYYVIKVRVEDLRTAVREATL